MAVNPNIQKKADDIRTKVYGKEVRESLASGLEEMSSDVVENEGRQSVVEGRQDSVESQWQAVSDEMTDKDVISAPEIIAARNGESNLKTRIDKDHQEVTAQLADIVQDSDITVTVGVNGDYPTINSAIEYLSRKTMKQGHTAEVKLLQGFVMREQLYVDGLNLGWIRISSEADVVTINAESLTRRDFVLPPYGDGYIGQIAPASAFAGINGAVLPTIDCLFYMDETAIGKIPFFVGNGAKLVINDKCGCTNSSSAGLYAVQGGEIMANGANVSNAKGNAISCFRSATVSFIAGDGSNSGENGVYADNNSFVDVSGADLTNAQAMGIWCDSSSQVQAGDCDVSGAGTTGVGAYSGSIVNCRNSKINNVGQRGVLARDGSTINARHSEILNAGQHGAEALQGGTVIVSDSTVSGVNRSVYALFGGTIVCNNAICLRGETESTNDIRVAHSGVIFAKDAVGGLGGSNGVANTITSDGVIYNHEDVTSPDGVFGEIHTATLSNGWTGTLSYSKTSNGTVWIRGLITAGTLTEGTSIANVGTGYRPPYLTAIQMNQANNNTQYGVHISTSGGLFLSGVTVAGDYHINQTYKI